MRIIVTAMEILVHSSKMDGKVAVPSGYNLDTHMLFQEMARIIKKLKLTEVKLDSVNQTIEWSKNV